MLSLYRFAADAFICITESSVALASLKQSFEQADEIPLVQALNALAFALAFAMSQKSLNQPSERKPCRFYFGFVRIRT